MPPALDVIRAGRDYAVYCDGRHIIDAISDDASGAWAFVAPPCFVPSAAILAALNAARLEN